jgi:anti-sigma factor RsiW
MNCEDVRGCLSSFYDGEIEEDAAAVISNHLANCTVCAAELHSFEQIGGLFRAGTEGRVCEGSAWAGISAQLNVHDNASWRRLPRLSRRLYSLTAVALAAAVAVGYWVAFLTSSEYSERVAAAHVHKTLTRFAQKPRAVVDELAAQYQGTAVSLENAEASLGYRPVVSKMPAAGYEVVSTHVLSMPCCKCPASLCVREDGTEFLIFEHNEAQPMWFGTSPMISARCCGQECHCAQMPEQLAVTWKVGPRFVTAIGVDGLEEIAKLMSVVNRGDTAG